MPHPYQQSCVARKSYYQEPSTTINDSHSLPSPRTRPGPRPTRPHLVHVGVELHHGGPLDQPDGHAHGLAALQQGVGAWRFDVHGVERGMVLTQSLRVSPTSYGESLHLQAQCVAARTDGVLHRAQVRTSAPREEVEPGGGAALETP